ncbi:unnamed protein product [Rotaria sp. Silwood1]|nr:unnamed protein product [Rotaria sp. Silwood1]CAF0862441.1 unnamed protein product [Rotaria sp. Silwood1]CAF3385874.1 unnamed protein product [Rotaria sp. Silwood1]CAF4633410.1 unnamed protein product [Rotaria sp. Silwood1]
MLEKRRSSSSVFNIPAKLPKKESILDKKIHFFGTQLTVGIVIGVFLALITIGLQCIAFFTPHWKEVSPITHSLYVDGVDALIRTEILIYFNSVHRFTRHSYGLFQRCEYLLDNATKLLIGHNEILHLGLNKQHKTCTKNFIPSYEDKNFNECHSLQYYRFCSKTGEKNFDISNDYLRATFDISLNSHLNINSISSCDCHYPTYIKACHVLGVIALISLSLTALLYGLFPFLKNRHQRLQVKCFGVLSSLFAMIFILSNLLTALNHLQYESTEYLTSIERHYKSSQIYKLSEDAKVSINRFLSSINIEIGYSTIIAWIAFILSIIDGILLMTTCKVTHYPEDIATLFSGIPSDSPRQISTVGNEEYKTLATPLTFSPHATDSQVLQRPPDSCPSPPRSPPAIVKTNTNEQSKVHSSSPSSCLKQYHSPRIHFEDEV